MKDTFAQEILGSVPDNNGRKDIPPSHIVRQLLEIMYRESYRVELYEHVNVFEFVLTLPENDYAVHVQVHNQDPISKATVPLLIKTMVTLLRAVDSKVKNVYRKAVVDFVIKHYPLLEVTRDSLMKDVRRLIASNDVFQCVKTPEDIRHSCLLLIDLDSDDVSDKNEPTITSL